jgi:hypothetical protein
VDRAVIARQGGYAVQAKYDSHELTRPAREAWLSKWELEVDPDQVLIPAERSRRAQAAMKAYMIGLSRKSAKARAKKAASLPRRVSPDVSAIEDTGDLS